MAQLNMAFEHGQTWETARANFEAAVERARADHGRWIHAVEWSDGRTAAALSGPSYRVVLEVDPTHVRATGQVPFAVKLLEPAVRRYVERTLREMGPGAA
jgi:hypothetical protein